MSPFLLTCYFQRLSYRGAGVYSTNMALLSVGGAAVEDRTNKLNWILPIIHLSSVCKLIGFSCEESYFHGKWGKMSSLNIQKLLFFKSVTEGVLGFFDTSSERWCLSH